MNREDFITRVKDGSKDRVYEWVSVTDSGNGRLKKDYAVYSSAGAGSYVDAYTSCATVAVNTETGKKSKSNYECRTYTGDYCRAVKGKDSTIEARQKLAQDCTTLFDEVSKVDNSPTYKQRVAIDQMNKLSKKGPEIPKLAVGEEAKQPRMLRNTYEEMKHFLGDLDFCKKNAGIFAPAKAGSGTISPVRSGSARP